MSDPVRPGDLETIFLQVVEQPVEARAAFLDRACAGRPELRTAIDKLLGAHDAAGGWVDDLRERIAAAAPAEFELATHQAGSIGPYRVVRLLGRGGMGTVLLAERADGQFDQQVAVKLVRAGMDREPSRRRFLAERQILARLHHPHIARLLDGGLTDDGRPYFVMEYVEGRPLTRYCDERRLSIDERLALFLTVCDAVQYAHRNLVVHRDLKPGNLLVTADGTVKLLDFGIAKILAADPAAPGATVTVDRPMTPLYAAPEQVRGEPVTTAVDVYALGVVLYELLAGRRPHESDGRTPAEVERAVLDEPPRAPSQVAGSAAALTRATRPDRLRRRLGGDLDTICLAAIRKEPERRYGSVDQMVEDVRRHVAGLPIAARGDAWTYRAAKFLRRHRAAVAGAAMLAVVVAGAAVVLGVQSARLARERDKAEQVASLLVDLFEVADPGEARGNAITAREVLDRGSLRIEETLAGQPEVQASLLDVLGRVYQNLGLYGKAGPLLERSLALRRDSPGTSDADLGASLNHVGELRRLTGDYDGAERTIREAIALNQTALGPRHPQLAQSLNHLGTILVRRGGHAEAESVLRAALSIARDQSGPDGVLVAETLNNLGAVLFAQGRDADAEPMFREALDIRRAALGSDHPLVAGSLNNLATVLARQGRYGEAERAHLEAVELYRRLLGSVHPRVATSLNNLALVRYAQGDLSGAEPLFREALAIRRSGLPAGHPDAAQTLANLGLLLQDTGRYDEAGPAYREALSIRRAAFGDDHPLVAQTLNNLGLLAQATGDLTGAEPLFQDAFETLRDSLGGDHPLVATSLHNLGALRAAQGDSDSAERLFQEALGIRRARLPADHPDTAYSLVALGRLVHDRGRHGEADTLLRQALRIRERVLEPGSALLAEAQLALGRCLLAREMNAEAEPLLLESHRALASASGLPGRAGQLERAARALAELYDRTNQPARAAIFRNGR